jgi:hypothetical protein
MAQTHIMQPEDSADLCESEFCSDYGSLPGLIRRDPGKRQQVELPPTLLVDRWADDQQPVPVR